MQASCQCGALSATLPGPCDQIVACHCRACQRRSGSPFGVVAYYPADQLELLGEPSSYTRIADSGGSFTTWFCPTCGTTLWCTIDLKPGMIGIPVGAIEDKRSFAPVRSVWEQSMHPWVAMPTDIPHYPKGRAS